MIPDKDQPKIHTRPANRLRGASATLPDPADENGLKGGMLRTIRYYLDRAAVPCAVLVISLSLTALAWQYVRENAEAGERVRFDETVRAVQGAVDRRTEAYLDAMFSARSFIYASESVERGEWMSFVDGLEPEKRFEGLQALGYAERVSPEEREAYTQRAGLPELSPGGERSAHFPVTFVGPSGSADQDALSYDWYSASAHRAAMDRARDSGSARATGKIYISTEAPPGVDADLVLRPGYAVYLPVYREEAPTRTVAERRRALEGFVFGFFRMDDLLGGIFSELSPMVDFEVYDGGALIPGQLLYDNDGVERARGGSATLFSDTRRLEVSGREWSLYFASLEKLGETGGGRLAAFVLATGVGVSLLLFGITFVLVRSRIVAERAGWKFEEANRELQAINRELEAFSYSVSHDLRAPLRSIDGFSQILLEDYEDELDEEGRDYLGRVRGSAQRMGQLIDDLLELSRVTRGPLRRSTVDLSGMAADVAGGLKASDTERRGRFVISDGLVARGDAKLLRVALENLLGNAWKFTSKEPEAMVEFGASWRGGMQVYYVRDNGVGFDATYADKLFGAFQRLHGPDEFEGTGVGLATVARVIRRHGGEVWAEGKVGEGATFYFTLEGKPRPGDVTQEIS